MNWGICTATGISMKDYEGCGATVCAACRYWIHDVKQKPFPYNWEEAGDFNG